MLKSILISIAFAVCGYIVGPTAPVTAQTESYEFEMSNVDFTVKSDDPFLMEDVAYKLPDMIDQITKKWLHDEYIPRGMRHTTVHVYYRDYNSAWCAVTDHPQIYVYSDEETLYETLRHELTHALLMIRYPDLPRWTHEGIASSYDGVGHQKMYRRILAWSRKSGTYPKLREIMAGVRFNGHNATAYTASNSLVKFLLLKNDKYTLFLYSSGKCTLERAYGYGSITELREAWIKWLNAPVEAKKPYRPVEATKP